MKPKATGGSRIELIRTIARNPNQKRLQCECSFKKCFNKEGAPAPSYAGVVKRSNTADCKSAGLCLRGFESLSLHQIAYAQKTSSEVF